MDKQNLFQYLHLMEDIARSIETRGINAGISMLRANIEGFKLKEAWDFIHANFKPSLKAHKDQLTEEFRKLENSPEAREFYRQNPASASAAMEFDGYWRR